MVIGSIAEVVVVVVVVYRISVEEATLLSPRHVMYQRVKTNNKRFRFRAYGSS